MPEDGKSKGYDHMIEDWKGHGVCSFGYFTVGNPSLQITDIIALQKLVFCQSFTRRFGRPFLAYGYKRGALKFLS